LEGQLSVDYEAIKPKSWTCPCCNNKCCCSYTECHQDHIHCFTYKRTLKRHSNSYIQTAKWLKKKDPPPPLASANAPAAGADAVAGETTPVKEEKVEKKEKKRKEREKGEKSEKSERKKSEKGRNR